MFTVLRISAVACLLAGCAGLKTDYDIGRERAQAYLAHHSELPSNTVEAIRSNSLRDGMTMDQVIAAWGRPAVVQKFRDGAVQYWFFGCDWPHACTNPDRGRSSGIFASPHDIYISQALFENGVVVDWQG